jgi:hypothetical protein
LYFGHVNHGLNAGGSPGDLGRPFFAIQATDWTAAQQSHEYDSASTENEASHSIRVIRTSSPKSPPVANLQESHYRWLNADDEHQQNHAKFGE